MGIPYPAEKVSWRRRSVRAESVVSLILNPVLLGEKWT